jgi:hypothetical protein
VLVYRRKPLATLDEFETSVPEYIGPITHRLVRTFLWVGKPFVA